jgi:hypothetical protein
VLDDDAGLATYERLVAGVEVVVAFLTVTRSPIANAFFMASFSPVGPGFHRS